MRHRKKLVSNKKSSWKFKDRSIYVSKKSLNSKKLPDNKKF